MGKMDISIGELRSAVIQGRGGSCLGCDCSPKFKISAPSGFVLMEASQSTNHRLSPGQLQVRVVCDANSSPHRPYNGGSIESCRSRRHLQAKA